MHWAQEQVSARPSTIAKIYRGRAGERNARVVAELTCTEVRLIHNGRYVAVKRLLRDG
jgi:hypothetical protein